MDLSVHEAAGFLGITSRTLRRQIARGELPARKVGSAFVLKLQDLPMSEPQRLKAAQSLLKLHQTVEDALALPTQAASAPVSSQLRTTPAASANRGYSLKTSALWEGAVQGISALEHGLASLPDRSEGLQVAHHALLQGLESLAVGLYTYETRRKREQLEQTRAYFSRGLARLLLCRARYQAAGTLEAAEGRLVISTVETLEATVMPFLSGLLRSLDGGKKNPQSGPEHAGR